MHDLPHAVFRAHDHCCPQSYRADRLLSANLGRGLLHSHDVGKLRSHVPREGLSVTHLSIADLRCSVVKNSSNLLPSTHDRAQGVTEGYILSIGVPLLYGFRVAFLRAHPGPGRIARSVRQPCFPQSPRPPPLLLTRRAGGEQCGRHRSCQSRPPKHVDDATEHIPPLASGQAPILKLRLVGGFPQDSYCLERAADVLREAGTSCPRWE